MVVSARIGYTARRCPRHCAWVLCYRRLRDVMVTSFRVVRISLRSRWFFWGYLAVITTAEALTSLVSAYLGLSVHALALIVLVFHRALATEESDRRLALALTLAPLIRLLSLGMPLLRFPQVAWYPIVSAPLLLATWMIIRQLGLSRRELGLCAGNLPVQLALTGFGVVLGVIEYIILRPEPLVASLSIEALWIPMLSLLIFTGFSEEVIFRGLFQSLAAPPLGRWALCYVSILFAVLHIGYLSLIDVLFVFSVGMLFAYIVRWSGSILGVTLAHGATNIMLFLIMPHLAHELPNTSAPGAWLPLPDVSHQFIPSGATNLIVPMAGWLVWAGAYTAMIVVGIARLRARVRAQANTGPLQRNNIRRLRRKSSLTYTELAQRTGIPARTLAEIEQGAMPITPEQARLIASGLGVAPYRLAVE